MKRCCCELFLFVLFFHFLIFICTQQIGSYQMIIFWEGQLGLFFCFFTLSNSCLSILSRLDVCPDILGAESANSYFTCKSRKKLKCLFITQQFEIYQTFSLHYLFIKNVSSFLLNDYYRRHIYTPFSIKP